MSSSLLFFKEMKDVVQHFVGGGTENDRVVYSHNFDNINDLPYYYFQVNNDSSFCKFPTSSLGQKVHD